MNETDLAELARLLAHARRSGTQLRRDQCDLSRISSFEEAEEVQSAAGLLYSHNRIGYGLAGTAPTTAGLLRCAEPIVGALFGEDRLTSGSTLDLTASMVGVGAQFAFVFGRSYPDAGEVCGVATVGDAIASCHLSLQVVGRRTEAALDLNDWTATADFGLAACFVEGPRIEGWRDAELAECEIQLKVDGHVWAAGWGRDTLGHPLAPIAWLARRLESRGEMIDAGDVVAVGSVTGLVQLTPGHVVLGAVGDLGVVTLRTA